MRHFGRPTRVRLRARHGGRSLFPRCPNHVEALAALVLFAFFTAVSMAAASTTFGFALSRGPVMRSYLTVAPAMGILSLAFGLWYSLGALNAVPYVF